MSIVGSKDCDEPWLGANDDSVTQFIIVIEDHPFSKVAFANSLKYIYVKVRNDLLY